MLNGTEHFKLFEYLENLFDDKLNMIFTSQPATIESFNADENTVSVTLDKENLHLEDIPISLFGNPSSYITTPTLEKGTKGILIFSKHDLFSWVEDGTDEHAKTDFSKNNAFFLIGATNQKNKITYNLNAIEIKTDKAIEMTSKNHTSIDSEKSIDLTAPKISLTDKDTGNELFSLLVETLNEMKGLATTLSQSKDMTYQKLLTNSSDIAGYISKFEALSSKYGGFK